MPSFSGVWNLTSQLQAIGQNLWLQNPGAPTIGTATASDASATVSFTAPAFNGNSPITGYRATSSPGGITATGAASPLSVTGLTNGTPYTFTVAATNAIGFGPESAASNSVSPTAFRGVYAGGINTATGFLATISYIEFSSLGSSTTFGNLTVARSTLGGGGSTTRGVFAGGSASGNNNSNFIDYITFATTGNAITFGALAVGRQNLQGACADTTRCVWGGGFDGSSYVTSMSYVTIASTGNSLNFGSLTVALGVMAGCSSPTRGIFAGGFASGNNSNVIQYITIASTGNATDFGDMAIGVIRGMAGCSSSTRGVFAGGFRDSPSGPTNLINYITIATTGNSSSFGDLSSGRESPAGCSSQTIGTFGGGQDSGSNQVTTLSSVTIATTGNASNFGNLTVASWRLAAASNCSGGVQ